MGRSAIPAECRQIRVHPAKDLHRVLDGDVELATYKRELANAAGD